MNKTARNYCFFGIIFSGLTIFFSVSFFLNIVKVFDIYMTVNYVAYFLGLAMVFAGLYCKEKGFKKTKVFCLGVGTVFILASLGFLGYSYGTGKISLFN